MIPLHNLEKVGEDRTACQVAVTLIENLTILSWSEVEMVASTKSLCISGFWLVEGSKPNLPILIANGIVNPLTEFGYVPIRMLNPSSIDVTVYKGMEVAVATRVEENHLATTHSSGHSTYTEKQVEIPWEKKELLLKLVKECEEDLSEEEREQLFILLLNYADVFAGRDGELGRTFLVQHSIATEDTR